MHQKAVTTLIRRDRFVATFDPRFFGLAVSIDWGKQFVLILPFLTLRWIVRKPAKRNYILRPLEGPKPPLNGTQPIRVMSQEQFSRKYGAGSRQAARSEVLIDVHPTTSGRRPTNVSLLQEAQVAHRR